MSDPADGRKEAPGPAPDPEAAPGSAASLKNAAEASSRSHSAIQRWVNEGGSLEPGSDPSDRMQVPGPSKEARDTAAGCRDRAEGDRRQAGVADTENGRRVLERSAASWDARADGIEEAENASAEQRAADRDLWASGERHDRSPAG